MSALTLVALLLCATPQDAEPPSPFFSELFAAHPERFAPVVQEAPARRVQVLLTEIGTPKDPQALVRHSYRLGAEYLYPASALKPAAAIAAIQAVQRVVKDQPSSVDLRAPITLSALLDGDAERTTSLALAIRKTLIVSSNRAYNALYEIAGQEALNRSMWAAGLKTVRLNHRLSRILSVEDNRRTPAWQILVAGQRYSVSAKRSPLALNNTLSRRLDVGQAYLENGRRIDQAMNFSEKNHMDLEALHGLLLLLVRPDTSHGLTGFDLAPEHRRFLIEALTHLPHESAWPSWSREKFDPYRFKPFLRGLERVRPRQSFILTSKAGKAYGFRVDNAYVVERSTGRAFVLSAGLHVDLDGTLNDDRYDYELADRFLADLAEAVARALWETRAPGAR